MSARSDIHAGRRRCTEPPNTRHIAVPTGCAAFPSGGEGVDTPQVGRQLGFFVQSLYNERVDERIRLGGRVELFFSQESDSVVQQVVIHGS